jgi:hypothetical protein
MTISIKFETKTCGRCNGKGRINAYSMVYGGVCFGCNGGGSKLTRKGAVARKAYDAAMTIEASELEVGMVIWDTGMDGKDRRRKIASISPDLAITFTHDNNYTRIMTATTKVRMALNSTNSHLAIAALAKLTGATIIEAEEVAA